MKFRSLSILMIAFLSALTFAGDGDEKAQTAAAPVQEQTAAPTQAAAGMVYTTEEARGSNGALPDELREALNRTINTSSEGLKEQVLADGTVMVDLKGRFQSALVVSIGEDGKLTSTCHSTAPGHKCSAEHKTEVAPVKE